MLLSLALAPHVERVLEAEFGLVGTLASLDGDVDCNYRLVNAGGPDFLVKASNEASAAALENTVAILEHLSASVIADQVERLRSTQDGERLAHFEHDGSRWSVRVTSFLPGVRLSAVEMPSEDALFQVGALVGNLDRAVADVPARQLPAHEWDLLGLTERREWVASVGDIALRRTLFECVDRFSKIVLPQLEQLPAQLIHNDADGDNILLAANDRPSVIDFGDAACAPKLVDLAITLAYVSARWKGAGPARSVFSGYVSVNPLDGVERQLLPAVVQSRQALRIINAHYSSAHTVGNDDYVLRNIAEATRAFSEQNLDYWKGILS